jgi:hypothetical protein
VVFDGEEASENAQSTWIIARSPEEARSKAEAQFGTKQFRLEQDPDCLEYVSSMHLETYLTFWTAHGSVADFGQWQSSVGQTLKTVTSSNFSLQVCWKPDGDIPRPVCINGR